MIRFSVEVVHADHVCNRVYSGVIPVARAHVLTTGITVAPYSRLVSMLQAWMRAGLRVIVSPSPPVTSTVSPVRAPAASSLCNDSGSVSSERGLLRCGSHAMSSMLMVCPFPPRSWRVVGGTWLVPITLLWRDCGAGCILAGAVASSLRPMTGTRRAWAGRAFPATFVTLYGPGAVRGPRVRCGLSSGFVSGLIEEVA